MQRINKKNVDERESCISEREFLEMNVKIRFKMAPAILFNGVGDAELIESKKSNQAIVVGAVIRGLVVKETFCTFRN